MRVRDLTPHRNVKRVRMILKDRDGNVIDRCAVANLPAVIADTFAELLRLRKRDGKATDGVTYELADL